VDDKSVESTEKDDVTGIGRSESQTCRKTGLRLTE